MFHADIVIEAIDHIYIASNFARMDL
jgi:hypothetical protein